MCSFSTANLKALLPKLSAMSILKSLIFCNIKLTIAKSPFSHASINLSFISYLKLELESKISLLYLLNQIVII